MSSVLMGRPRFELGRVVERTFGAISANAATLLLAALLFYGLPQALLAFGLTGLGGNGNYVGAFMVAAIGWLASLICGILLQGVVTHTVVADLLGRKPTMGESFQAAMRSFWMLLAVGFVSGLGVTIGTILLIVPGVFLALMWFVVGPVVVAERADFGDAFSRSMKLTENHRWMLLLLAVIYFVAVVVLSMPIAMISALFGVAGAIVTAVLQSLISLVGAAGVAAVYVELRTVKEGGGRDNIAAIFE